MKYIEIKNLSINFGKENILNNVNLEVNSGQRIGIIGENGSGKTTLVETILGVNNARVHGILHYLNNINYDMKAVFQEYQYDGGFSLKTIYKNYCNLNKTPVRKDLKELFAHYGLAGMQNKRFHKLSGGQKQKFKLLMCLELHPKLLVLDEITTSLDFKWRQEILKMIQLYLEQNPECSLLLVSHDYNELVKLTDTYYLVKDKTLYPVFDLKPHFEIYKDHEDLKELFQ